MSEGFRAKVRMYRQGIGDCFLVQLPRGGGAPFTMVIDCGVVLGTPDARERMTAIADDLQRTTGGDPDRGEAGHIDLLVITHEHWDHVSGFGQVADWDKRFDVGTVWAGWTENGDDEQAQRLDKIKTETLNALTAAAMRTSAAADDESALLISLLGFYGISESDFSARMTTRQARDIALKLGEGDPTYLEPGGDPVRLACDGDVRVYVLGPPRNEKLLKKADPSTVDPETYVEDEKTGDENRAGEADEPVPVVLVDGDRRGNPFAAALEIPINHAKNVDFFRRSYFEAIEQPVTSKTDRRHVESLSNDSDWRRIDSAWAGSFAEMAMKLDSATNNTSLAFAIEMGGKGGDVLLFAADAQVGNWLSWHNVKWTGAGEGTTASDLLARTVFYKVGHHGSHNATLRKHGLEMMTNKEKLTAMVPVDHEIATKKRWHEMPFDVLLAELNEAAQGRVLRADQPVPGRPSGVLKKDWQAFADRVAEGDDGLWYEITF